MSDITKWSLQETLEKIKSGEISLTDINKAYHERIDRLNPKLNAYLEVNEKSDKIPSAIKDAISTENIKTTSSSKILEDYIPPYNATVINRLEENGVSVVGKTNMDEFAMGSSGENSAFGSTKNPWDLTKVSGGSSSGSAVAVAAGLAVFSLGSDTGGSIRQPASLCGAVGFKPSYGTVSRYGLIAMASSLDQIGTFTKTVGDVRLIMNWISGPDEKDANCFSKTEVDQKRSDVKGLKIGVPVQYFGKGLDEGVEKVVRQAIAELEELGAEVVEVNLPHTEYAIATYYIVMASEVSSNLARFSGIRYGGQRNLFGDEVKRRIMLGTFALSTGYFDDYFIKAAKVRTLIIQDFEKAFEKCDVIMSPVSPTTAWNLGEKIDDPLKMYLSDVYTIPASLAGLPGISVPAGFSDDLPVGLQIIGPYLKDGLVLDVAEVYETATDWHKEWPVL